MEITSIPAVFKSGKLLPLVPLNLQEHERVELTIVRASIEREASEDEYVPYIAYEADASVTLEQVQQALAKIPGSLVQDFSRERDERF